MKPYSCPRFSAPCAAAITDRNHVFGLYQQNKSSTSKVNFRQTNICCKSVLEAAKLAYAEKTSLSFPRNMALAAFGKLLIAFSTKVRLLYLHYLIYFVLSFASDQLQCFVRNVSKNLSFDDSNISLPTFLLELI